MKDKQPLKEVLIIVSSNVLTEILIRILEQLF
jgi:hypothetical protein